MGKKRFNWKSRQIVQTVIDNSITKKIQLELDVKGNYDQSNELVLPSKKRKTKIKKEKTTITRILSKRQRKNLEKIVEKKKKKETRASLLEALQQVQATPEELQKLTSISSIQTKGLKRHYKEEEAPEKFKTRRLDVAEPPGGGAPKLNSLKGAKRRQYLVEMGRNKDDPNVVGFDSSGSSDLESSDSDSEEVKEEPPILNNNNDTDSDNKVVTENNTAHASSTNAQPLNTENNTTHASSINAQPLNTKNNAHASSTNAQSVITKTHAPRKPAIFVDVFRTDEIQTARLKLPILAEEQQIMETISENSVVIIAGETGSGKTTQLPQFLYEAGYARHNKQIAITEPRRVAAIAMSHRVAEEMNLSDRQVSYLIRFEGNYTDETRIKFMTDGVLLRELKSDFLLSRYSVVILDEAHERSVFTDILIGFLSRIVKMRAKRRDPLKLIIMSATLRLEDFTNNRRLFKVSPPVINVDARQFPVTVHFNKRTKDDYLNESYLKVTKIHRTLPEGGILVFLTGQQEVNTLVRRLRKAFPYQATPLVAQTSKLPSKKGGKKLIIPSIDLDQFNAQPQDGGDGDNSDNSDDDNEDLINRSEPLWVLPLYSLLPTEKQSRVFRAPPSGIRLCIVATNVAETSLTIPGIKYVVDCGRSKVKLYDKVTGVTSYLVTWTSKASANQRAGRAGRIAPGHCYRLYSSAIFNDTFPDFNPPEIQQKPIDDLVLQMKCLKIERIANFPFPTAPDLMQLNIALKRLEILGALKRNGAITPLGQTISKFPVLPRFGKMLALSCQRNLLAYSICLVAALSVQEVLLETPIAGEDEQVKVVRKKWAELRRQWAGQNNCYCLGDAMVLMRAVGGAEYANAQGQLEKFCFKHGLRLKAITEIRKLRLQLTNEVKLQVDDLDLIVDPTMAPPTDQQAKWLRQILLSSCGDQLARRKIDLIGVPSERRANLKLAYNANNIEEPVYLNSSSIFKKDPPDFVLYQEIYEVNGKMFMRGVTAIEPQWLPLYLPALCNLSAPLLEPQPRFNADDGRVYCYVSGTFGSQAWELPQSEIEYPQTIDAYKWFGRFFLEGKVCPKLGKYEKELLSRPEIMVKSWARLQDKTEALLKALMLKEVRDKKKLVEVWKMEPNYLLEQYLRWVPQSAYNEVTLLWPPLN